MHTPIALVAATSLAALLPAQLAGTYSVNPNWPAFPGNFTSLAAATAALAAQGVAGPVVVELYDDAGPFTESSTFTTSNGTYNPSTAVLVLTSWNGASASNRVTFRPAPGEAPILDATGRGMGIFWGGADHVTVEGLTIRNATFDAISLYAETSHGVATDPVIRRCTIHDCGGTGVTVYGNSSQPVNTLIESNVFYSLQKTNAGAFNTTGRFGYVTTRRSTNTRVVHNTFVMDTGVGGSCCVLGAYPSGTTEQPFAEFSNNVVFKLAAAGKPIVRIQSPSNAAILTPPVCESNCYFDLTSSPFALWGTSAGTTAATLLDWQQTAQKDLASLWADPQFLDFSARDYHLQFTSPCLAASTVDFGATTDLDGQPRTLSRDFGADEISGAVRVAHGSGCPGGNNRTPRLGTNTWPFLGNAGFALHVDDFAAGQPVFFAASLAASSTPLPVGGSCAVWLDTASTALLPGFGVADPTGHTNLLLPLPANAAFVGLTFAYQAAGVDPTAAIGFSVSNAMVCTLGF
jgi:hypothetical protein